MYTEKYKKDMLAFYKEIGLGEVDVIELDRDSFEFDIVKAKLGDIFIFSTLGLGLLQNERGYGMELIFSLGEDDAKDSEWIIDFARIFELSMLNSNNITVGDIIMLPQNMPKPRDYMSGMALIPFSVNGIFEDMVKAAGNEVGLMSILPIYDEEINFYLTKGANEFITRIAHFYNDNDNILMPLNLDRESMCLDWRKDIKIRKEEVINVLPEEIAYKRCFISDRIMVCGEPVGYMYREDVDEASPFDSGWVFMSGKETKEELNDGLSFGVYELYHICGYDDSIQLFLESESPIAYERRSDGMFEEVPIDEDRTFNIESLLGNDKENVFYSYKPHLDKIRAKKLPVDEKRAIDHIAIYIIIAWKLKLLDYEVFIKDKGIYKDDFLFDIAKMDVDKIGDFLIENCDGGIDLNMFSLEGIIFTNYYFNREKDSYPQEIDKYTKARYKREGLDTDIAQTEEYLFIPADEDYINTMVEVSKKHFYEFEETIVKRRKKGVLSREFRKKVKEQEALIGNPNYDMDYGDVVAMIVDEADKLVRNYIFLYDEIDKDVEFSLFLAEYLIKENSIFSLNWIFGVLGNSENIANEYAIGEWFHYMGYGALARGMIDIAFEYFKNGCERDPEYMWNWYYLAITSLEMKNQGSVFDKAMRKCQEFASKEYKFKALIDDLRAGKSSIHQLLAHLDKSRKDKAYQKKLISEDISSFNEEELSNYIRAMGAKVDNSKLEKVCLILNPEMNLEDFDPMNIYSTIKSPEGEIYISMAMGVGFFSNMDLDYLTDIVNELSTGKYNNLTIADDMEMRLTYISINEKYEVNMEYEGVSESVSVTLTLGRKDRNKMRLVSSDSVREKLEERYNHYIGYGKSM